MRKLLLSCSMTLLFSACATSNSAQNNPLGTVPAIDVPRYMGKWYEIARLPNRFQNMCASNVSATYAQKADGKLSVINTCKNPTAQ